MATLQEIRKQRYPSVKAFAHAASLSYNQASNWLRGRDSSLNPEPLLLLLGLSQDEFYNAWAETDAYETKKWQEKHPPATPEQIAAHEASIKAYVGQQPHS